MIEMVSDPDDLRIIDDLPFLFDEGSMQMGVEEEVLDTETVRIDIMDEANGKHSVFIVVSPSIGYRSERFSVQKHLLTEGIITYFPRRKS